MKEPLRLHAETFPPSGGMAADGMKKLLGNPALTLLQTMVREAVQNSWDARLRDGGVSFRVSLRRLKPGEAACLKEQVLHELPRPAGSRGPLRQLLASPEPVILELSDWGTRGLGGPTRADIVPGKGEHNDFVNFVRNMGARRDTAQGGGTYGYGKSSLYQMSRCSTVLIDSLSVDHGGRERRRFIGCHLGDAADVGARARLTGRHWWGVGDPEDGLVEPAGGRAAAKLAASLGLPPREEGHTGTTLAVLDPDTDDLPLEDVAARVIETLLWFLWPKMIAGNDGHPPIRFQVEVDGDPIEIPHPESFPPLDLLVEAYRAVKARSANVEEIWSERPVRLLGHLATSRGFRRDRIHLTDPDDSLIPHSCSHIALMRPVELVVRYEEGTALPSEAHEWAGVFICDDDREVEQAFADAEPPAHDDWIPDKMPKGWGKTFVRVALRQIRAIASTFALPDPGAAGGVSPQPSLAWAADRMGAFIPFLSQPAIGGTRSGGNPRARWRVSSPRFHTLEEGSGGGEAIFELEVMNGTTGALSIHATPCLVIDGALAEASEAGELDDRFLGWEDIEGASVRAERTLVVAPGTQGTYHARVAVPDDAAIGLRVTTAGAAVA